MLEIPISETSEIKIGAEGLEEIIQNVKVILSTPKGSVVLDREFGVEGFLDDPQPEAKIRFEINAIDAIEKYEKRVKVKYVKWKQIDADGKMVPVVGLEVVE